jgi:2-polyprenyl-3-methyl-5-hydroxy-6-metoxy-1,4-benzoquinol methylase
MTPLAELKNVHRSTWAAGDYAAVAELIDEAPPGDLLARAQIAPGLDVLDVATGTGNVAIKAAAAGAQVVGLDRGWAQVVGLDLTPGSWRPHGEGPAGTT